MSNPLVSNLHETSPIVSDALTGFDHQRVGGALIGPTMSHQQDSSVNFWKHVDNSDIDGCWTWTSTKTANGYGLFRYFGVKRLAHRIAYTLCLGPIPDGKYIDHACCNRLCVNPSHLRPCTHSENCRNQKRRGLNTSGFKGVSRDKNKWRAYVNIDGKYKHLGVFSTPEEAHKKYCEVASTEYGPFFNPGA